MIISKIKSLLKNKPNQHLEQNIINLDTTDRIYHVLRKAGIETIGDLTELSRNDLKGVRRMNRRGIVEIEGLLKGIGLELRKGE